MSRVARSRAEAGSGVVGPGVVDADVAAEGREGPVSGLVRDRPVGCSAQVGVGDEPRA